MAKEAFTPTDRRDWRGLIQARTTAMLRALDTQLGGSVDTIIAELRAREGIVLTEEQLDQLIEKCDEQIKAEVEKHLGDEKRRVEIEIEETNDTFDEKDREMKARHRREWEAQADERKKTLEGLRAKLRDTEKRIAQEHTGEILKQKQEYQRERLHVSERERVISAEAEQRVQIVRASKGRLQNMITDAGHQALEKLMMAKSAEEAQLLLQSIPTVNEAVELCRSADGLKTLMQKLDPNIKCLPGPAPEPNRVKPVEAEIVDDDDDIPTTTDDLDIDTENDWQRNREHARIYERTGAREE